MAKHIWAWAKAAGRSGWGIVAVLAVVGLGVVLGLSQKTARGQSFTITDWTYTGTPVPCAGCNGCGCEAPTYVTVADMLQINIQNGGVLYTQPLMTKIGRLGPIQISGVWNSMVSGMSQLGRGFVASYDVNAQVTDPGDNETVTIRVYPGAIYTFTKYDGVYSSSDCGLEMTLTKDGNGDYALENKYGDVVNIDGSTGDVTSFVDRNGNSMTVAFNEYHQLETIGTDRGETITASADADGFLDEMDDPWTFAHDSHGNLTSITTPTTADQSSGITVNLTFDASDRLTGIQDGRGNSTTIAYVSSSRKVYTVTRNSHTTTFAYYSGRTEMTDPNGNVHRYYFTGNKTTKVDMYVSSQSKYATEYRWSGDHVVTTVYPRGNRVDSTFSGGDLTERRRKTTDTDNTSSTDIVESWTYTNHFPVTYTDGLGHQTTYSRDSAGNLTGATYPTVTDPATQTASESWTYNSYGQKTQHTDAEGYVVAYTYFSNSQNPEYGLLQKIEVDPTGLDLETTFTYSAAGDVATVTDSRGNAVTTTWDNLRRRTAVTMPSPFTNYETQYHYDANSNLTEVRVHNVDKAGNVVSANEWLSTTYTYTAEDKLATIVEEVTSSTTRTTSFTYDANLNRTRVTKPEGNQEDWTYSERDLVATHVVAPGAAYEATTSYSYDDNGNLTTLTNPRSYATSYVFDLFDRRTKETNVAGHYTEWDFDKAGNVTEIRRKNSSDTLLQRETYAYDERNRRYEISAYRDDPTSTTFSDAVTTIARYKTGEVYTVTNPRSKVTTYEIDAAHRVETISDAMANEVTRTFDDNGNVTAWSVAEKDGSNTVTHQYEASFDALNRRTAVREIDRTNSSNVLETTYAYDSRSNMVFLVNAEGNPSRYTFDDLGRLTKKEGALTLGQTINDFSTAQVTEWGFDLNNRLTSHKDDGTNESTWVYDLADRATNMAYPDTSGVQYEFDTASNVTEVTDPAGNVIADTFNNLNQNTSRSVTRATGWLDTTTETRTFDALGRMTKNEDDDYKVEYTYAVIGLRSYVYEEIQAYATGSAYSKTVTRTWDVNGNKATEAYPSGLSVTYAWNDIDNLSSISDGTNTIASYSYIGLRPKVTTFQNNTTDTRSYAGFRDEVAEVKHETSTPTTIVDLQYGYNKNHTRMFERFGSSGSTGEAFSYDKLERLTTAWMGSATPSAPSSAAYVSKIDYNMDDDGNRTSVVVTPYQQSPSTTSYTTNTLNQYTVVGGTNRSHDSNGNVTDDGTHKFKYNYLNLICEVRLTSNNNLVAEYKYDANGRRVEKAVSGGITERYVYSGVETIATYNGSNTWKQDFVFGQGIDEVVMLEEADALDYDADQNTSETTRSFYHRNALGSVMEITDMSQAKAVSYRYDPYGAITITRGGQSQSTDPLGQHWSYTARYYDAESGFYYYRARHLGLAVGRFIERDPLGYGPGPSLYLYGESAPTSRCDPLGLKSTAEKMAGCESQKGGRACQECCGFAVWDEKKEIDKKYAAEAKTCATTHIPAATASGDSEVIAEAVLGAIEVVEVVAAHVEGPVGFLAHPTSAAGSASGVVHAAKKAAAAIAGQQKSGDDPAGYARCMISVAMAKKTKMDKLYDLYEGCMEKCRDPDKHNCVTEITSTWEAWEYLMNTPDYRPGK